MRIVVAVWLLLFSPVATFCQERELKKAIAECSAVDDVTDRLECFDSLARSVAKVAAPDLAVSEQGSIDTPTPGQWQVHVAKDPLNDTTIVGLSLLGNDLKAQLVMRCMQKKVDVLLSWRGRFMGATDPTVWTRLGTAKAEKKRWSISSDHKAAFLAGDTRPFVQQLLSVDRLVVQTDHFAQGRITETFELHGLKDAIGPVKGECRIQ